MKDQPISLFILDYSLPEMSGIELCRRIRQTDSQTPIMFYSGMAQPGGAAASAPEVDIRRDATVEAVQRVMPSVVNVATEELVPVRDPLENLFREFFDPYHRRHQPNTQYSLGSGVIIDEEGFVLTNFHVVNRARRVWVKLADGREFECERISGTSFSDVALLKIRATKGEKFTAVKFGADDDLLLGETVLALGNPFGLGGSVSRGILSSKSRRPPTESEPLDVLDWLQTDAAINPGNSGGPLLNADGELIGINVALRSDAQNIAFALNADTVQQVLSRRLSASRKLGVYHGLDVREKVVEEGADRAKAIVHEVADNTPAAAAGLKEGDQIVRLGEVRVTNRFDVERSLWDVRTGETVEVMILRSGREVRIPMKIDRETHTASR